MASNLRKVPNLRIVAARTYCGGQAAACKTQQQPILEVESTNLPNKLVVASINPDAPLTRVSIIVKAGSRNETPENLGVAHTLRACTGLTTKNASQFAITRNIQQVGASLTATANREVISYNLEGSKKAVLNTLRFLTEVTTQQEFRPWEVAETVPRMRLELAQRPPQLRAVDLLHKAAFRRGLGNSLFIPKYRLGSISSETLQHFVASNFTSDRTAVVGSGIGHDVLVEYASKLPLPSGEGEYTPQVYKGGEVRSDKAGENAYIAIGTASAGICQEKDLIAYNILQRALGGSPSIKWGISDHGVLSKCLGDLDEQFAMAAFNYVYSDIGLLGVIAAAPSKCSGIIVEAAIKALKTTSFDDQIINKAKNQLKADILMAAESKSAALEEVGIQAALKGTVKTPDQVLAEVDAVTTAAVSAIAKKIASQPLSIASYGNLASVPYLDEINS